MFCGLWGEPIQNLEFSYGNLMGTPQTSSRHILFPLQTPTTVEIQKVYSALISTIKASAENDTKDGQKVRSHQWPRWFRALKPLRQTLGFLFVGSVSLGFNALRHLRIYCIGLQNRMARENET